MAAVIGQVTGLYPLYASDWKRISSIKFTKYIHQIGKIPCDFPMWDSYAIHLTAYRMLAVCSCVLLLNYEMLL